MKTLFLELFIMCESQGQPVLAFVIKIMAPVYTLFFRSVLCEKNFFVCRCICFYLVYNLKQKDFKKFVIPKFNIFCVIFAIV